MSCVRVLKICCLFVMTIILWSVLFAFSFKVHSVHSKTDFTCFFYLSKQIPYRSFKCFCLSVQFHSEGLALYNMMFHMCKFSYNRYNFVCFRTTLSFFHVNNAFFVYRQNLRMRRGVLEGTLFGLEVITPKWLDHCYWGYGGRVGPCECDLWTIIVWRFIFFRWWC